ncbi:MAG: RDD family protein [Gammaproteobacteria bacterium]|nr:RDD family protein [Gammaproteobacteria bacterium]
MNKSGLLLRRLGAIAYDSLILAAILIAATAIMLLLNGGASITPGTLWYQGSLAALIIFYFAWSWWRGGQTIGMVAWRLRLRSDTGRLSLLRCLARALLAVFSWLPAGLGFLWILVDTRGRAWHDIASGTCMELPQWLSNPAQRNEGNNE